jgi:DMSO/TMAO reductase YedYZ molybdopterin-dependent catalytic subunit
LGRGIAGPVLSAADAWKGRRLERGVVRHGAGVGLGVSRGGLLEEHDGDVNLSVRAGLSGLAAAAVAVGVAEVVAVLTGPLSAPLLAVGGVVVDHVPGSVKDVGVRVFGVHDKTALIVGTAVLLAAYAYALGVVALRSWRVALGGIGLFALVGVASAMTRHDAGAFAWLPTVVGAGLTVWVLGYLLELAGAPGRSAAAPAGAGSRAGAEDAVAAGAVAQGAGVGAGTGVGVSGLGVSGQVRPAGADGLWHDAAETEKPGTGVDAYSQGSRRLFLRRLGIVAAVAAVSGVAGRLLTSRRAVTAARKEVVLPAPRQSVPPLPAGVQVPGASSYVSSNKDFYRIDTALYPPQVDPSTWQLRIHGMVRNPITISWDELLRRPMVERYVTLACVSNEVGGDLIGNALWLGTPIKELLDQADPLPGADQVIQRSVDGWTCGSPTAVLRDGRDALLAVGMNGAALPVEHGFPVRMVVPGLYGYVSACKWITEIELSRFSDFDAYWVPRGWSQQAPIKTESRIDTPRDGASRKAGTVVVAGVAWAQHRGISKVEVQVDGGPWVVATLAPTISSDTWREWSYAWPATKGKHILSVRATDIGGQTQTSTPAPPAPDGATGWHSVQVRVD